MQGTTTNPSHWHVATGLAGYGPEGSDGFACYATLADALEGAREEMRSFVDMAHDAAHGFGDAGQFEDAWLEVLRCERLEVLRANLDPARRDAPLYRDRAGYPPGDERWCKLQESQAADFPHDVSHNTRLYLWQCEDPAGCEHCEEEH